jgi:RimJ/RimL family protein N-acetyltransferase
MQTTESTLQVRIADLSDVAAISELADRIWRKHYSSIIGSDQIDYMLNLFYSHAALQQQIKEGQVFHLIYQHNNFIGYIATSEKTSGHYFLHKFYIDQYVQGKGIGKAAFATITANYANLKSWRLTVNRKNYTSINFYFRLGFTIERVEDFDIGNGYLMEDFVMLWTKPTAY